MCPMAKPNHALSQREQGVGFQSLPNLHSPFGKPAVLKITGTVAHITWSNRPPVSQQCLEKGSKEQNVKTQALRFFFGGDLVTLFISFPKIDFLPSLGGEGVPALLVGDPFLPCLDELDAAGEGEREAPFFGERVLRGLDGLDLEGDELCFDAVEATLVPDFVAEGFRLELVGTDSWETSEASSMFFF